MFVEMLSQRGQQRIRRPRLSGWQPGLAVWHSTRQQAILATALGAMTLVGLALLMGHWGFDDPYITYRYAHNLLAGRGFVYNVGQRILSTTTPFYAALLAAGGLLWPDLPALSNLLSALALVLAAALLGTWAWKRGQQSVGMVLSLLLVFWPLLLMTFGTEMCLYLLALLAAFYAYDRSYLPGAAGALALAAMVRPDGVLAALALAVYHLLLRKPIPWRPVMLYVGLVAAWYAGLWLYFGSPIPVSLAAKQQQGQMAISTRFAAGFVTMVRDYGRQPLYWLHGALALLGLGCAVTRSRHWTPLLLWTVLYFLAYTALGVSRYFWYYAPLVPAFVILVAEGSGALIRRLVRTNLPRPLVLGAVGLLLIALLAPLGQGVTLAAWRPDPRLEVYRQIGQWLASHTPPTASVGSLEVGIIGYYAGRPIVDFAGLIQPEVADHLTPAGTYQDSAIWAIQAYRPDYVVLRRDAFSGMAGSEWFQRAYLPIRDFANRQQLWLTVYERSDKP